MDRLPLIKTLNTLPSSQFNLLLLVLNPPAGVVPPPSAAQSDRVFALFEWVEGAGGCGLAALGEALASVLPSAAMPAPPAPKPVDVPEKSESRREEVVSSERYEVALSFAEEDRPLVQALVDIWYRPR